MLKKLFILFSIIFLSLILIESALGETTTITISNPLGETSDVLTLIDKILNFLLGIALVLTPIMIVYAGFLYITAAGNEEKVKTANKVLIWALIGLAVVLIAKGVPALIKEFLGTSKEICEPACKDYFHCDKGECVDNCYNIQCPTGQNCQSLPTGHECVPGNAINP